ncbi:MAG: C40 family peptidase [Bacteroidales bacterium]|jgi:hypothetical protein
MNNKIRITGIILLTAGLIISCKPEKNDLETAKFLIDSIQSQTIADSRIEVFSIKPAFYEDGIILRGKTTNQEAVAKLTAVLKQERIVYTDSIVRLPDPALGEKLWGLVTISVANIKYTAAHSAEMATQALMGTPVKILQEDNGWLLIQTPDRYIAWTESAGIARLTQSQIDQWKTSVRFIYLGDNGLILNAPEKNAIPVSDIVLGGILSINGKEAARGNYLPVALPDGRTGYIAGEDCQEFKTWSDQVSMDSIALVKSAFHLMGRPYLWGGTSIKGMDCSGFTRTIYLNGGLILSRDASQQVLQGMEVPTSDIWKGLKMGDLLFFGRRATTEVTEKVSHVGMYIGGSEFIHCSGMVKVNSLDSARTNFKPYYHTNLLHVKRIIGTSTLPDSFKALGWYN